MTIEGNKLRFSLYMYLRNTVVFIGVFPTRYRADCIGARYAIDWEGGWDYDVEEL